MIDAFAAAAPEPSLAILRDAVQLALDGGELTPASSAAQIRALLRGRGLRCTVSQSRTLRDEVSADDADTLGRRLTAARVARGLTRIELARIVDCSESYLSYLEADARSPSERLLTALADAVRREAEWLRTGEESSTSRLVDRALELAWQGLRGAEWDAVEEQVARVLDQPHDRPLRVDEAEAALLLRGRSRVATGREEEGLALLEPLVHGVLAGRSDVDPVVLGQGYVRALVNTGGDDVATLAKASIIGQQLLATAGDRRDDDWWRLAATIMVVHLRLSPVDLAEAHGRWWLGQLEDQDVHRHPSGAAALYWNLGVTDLLRGRLTDALDKLTTARSLQDPQAYPSDGATLRLVLADTLALTRPDRVAEAIAEMEDCRAPLLRHGYATASGEWLLCRARAEAIAGRPDRALAMLGELQEQDTSAEHRFEALLLAGDLHRAGQGEEHPQDALRAYDEAEQLLREHPTTPAWARPWRDLGDRRRLLGDVTGASEAYRQALDLMQITPSVILPPHGTPR